MNFELFQGRIPSIWSQLPFEIDLMLRATGLLILAWVLVIALRRANPRWRVLVWRAYLCGLLALPVVMLVVPGYEIPIKAVTNDNVSPVQVFMDGVEIKFGEPGSTIGEPLPPYARINDPIPLFIGEPGRPWENRFPQIVNSPPQLLEAQSGLIGGGAEIPGYPTWHSEPWPFLLVWLAGLSLLSIRICFGLRGIRRLVRESTPAPEDLTHECDRVTRNLGVSRTVSVRILNAKTSSPLLVGVRNPTILLPKQLANDSTPADLSAIFAHEIAHIRSNDLAWNNILQALSYILWFHPLVWLIRESHASACEEVSDAISAEYVGDTETYSRTLARVAVEMVATPPTIATVPMARVPEISRRLKILKRGVFSSPLSRHWIVAFSVLALVILLSVGGARLVSAEESEPATESLDKINEGKSSTPEGPEEDLNDKPNSEAHSTEDRSGGNASISATDEDNPLLQRELTKWREWRANCAPEDEEIPDSVSKAAQDGLPIVDNCLLMPREPDGSTIKEAFKWAAQYYDVAPKPCTIKGKVIGGDGKPIKGAVVNAGLRFRVGQRVAKSAHLEPIATNGNGEFAFDTVVEGSYVLRVLATGFLGTEKEPLTVDRDNPISEVELVLQTGSSLRGQVKGPEGNPVAGVHVEVCGHNRLGGGTGYSFNHQQLNSTTDDQGRFQIDVEEAGTYNLLCLPDHFASQIAYEVAPENDDAKIELTRGGTVRGRVVTLKNGHEVPVQGATVTAESADHSAYSWLKFKHVLSDASGYFQIEHLQTKYRFQKFPPRYEYLPRGWLISCRGHQKSVPLGEGETAKDIDFEVPESDQWKISGRVVDSETGKPIQRFVIDRTVPSGGLSPHWQSETACENVDGIFDLTFQKIKPDWIIRVRAPGYRTAYSKPLTGTEGDQVVILELVPGGQPKVLILSPDGSAAPGAEIIFARPDHHLRIKNGRPDIDAALIINSDASGNFQVPDWPLAFHLVVLHDTGYAQIASSSITANAEVSLEPWAKLQGVVMTEEGPWPEQEIRMFNYPGNFGVESDLRAMYEFTSRSSSDGRFSFDRVFPGAYAVGRHPFIYRFENLPTSAPSHTKKVTLKTGETVDMVIGGPGTTLTGHVEVNQTLASPIDLHQGWVNLKRRKGFLGELFDVEFDSTTTRRYVTRLHSDGTFQIPAVSPGSYEMEIKLMHEDTVGDHGLHVPIGKLKQNIKVPEPSTDGDHVEVDLGSLKVNISKG